MQILKGPRSKGDACNVIKDNSECGAVKPP